MIRGTASTKRRQYWTAIKSKSKSNTVVILIKLSHNLISKFTFNINNDNLIEMFPFAEGAMARGAVARTVWPYMLSISLAYCVTLCLFPGIESEIISCRLHSWMPVILMAIFNAADFIGKVWERILPPFVHITNHWQKGINGFENYKIFLLDFLSKSFFSDARLTRVFVGEKCAGISLIGEGYYCAFDGFMRSAWALGFGARRCLGDVPVYGAGIKQWSIGECAHDRCAKQSTSSLQRAHRWDTEDQTVNPLEWGVTGFYAFVVLYMCLNLQGIWWHWAIASASRPVPSSRTSFNTGWIHKTTASEVHVKTRRPIRRLIYWMRRS